MKKCLTWILCIALCLSPLAGARADLWSDLTDTMGTAASSIEEGLGSVTSTAADWLSSAAGLLSEAYDIAAAWAAGAVNAVGQEIQDLWKSVSPTLQDWMNKVSSFLSENSSRFGSTIVTAWNSIREAVTQYGEIILNTAERSASEAASQAFQRLIDSLINTMFKTVLSELGLE